MEEKTDEDQKAADLKKSEDRPPTEKPLEQILSGVAEELKGFSVEEVAAVIDGNPSLRLALEPLAQIYTRPHQEAARRLDEERRGLVQEMWRDRVIVGSLPLVTIDVEEGRITGINDPALRLFRGHVINEDQETPKPESPSEGVEIDQATQAEVRRRIEEGLVGKLWIDELVHPDDRERTTKRHNQHVREAESGKVSPWGDIVKVNLGPDKTGLCLVVNIPISRRTPKEVAILTINLGDFGASLASELSALRFISDTLHALKTPLTSVKGYTQLLSIMLSQEKPPEPDIIKNHAGIISTAADSMAHILDDLFTFAAVESKEEVVQESVDILEIVTDAHKEQAILAQDFDADVSIVDGRWRAVVGDPNLLKLVIDNLLSNAIKYCRPAEGVRGNVTVEFHIVGDEGELWVTNDSQLLPPDEVEKLQQPAERFDRLLTHRKKGIQGTGLGRSIVGEAVAKMGGRVVGEYIKPEDKEYATVRFKVSLPLVPAQN